MEENRLLIDWLTVRTSIHSLQQVKQLLGLEEVEWALQSGRYGYMTRWQFASINIMCDGRDDMGICFEMSGQGCRDFESLGSGNYQAIFDEVGANPDDMQITRLDVAFDDHTGLLDMDTLCEDTRAGRYVSRWSSKSTKVIYSVGGNSIEFGSKTSEIFLRIYDKAKERGFEDGRHWIRLELQFRRDRAMSFVFSDGDFWSKYRGVMANYLRFVVPLPGDQNRSRWATTYYWSKFLDGAVPMRLWTSAGISYNLASAEQYVYHQAGSALLSVLVIRGLDNFLDDLLSSRGVFSGKYKALLAAHGFSFDSGIPVETVKYWRDLVRQYIIDSREEVDDYDECAEYLV